MPILLEDDRMCYVCGQDNPHGLRLAFEHTQKGVLRASVTFLKHHQGYKGVVHGGMMAMVLDEMMVNLAWKEGFPAVTAELTVRLKKPTKIGQKVLLEGHLKKGKGRVLHAAALAKDEKGDILASATATCICLRSSQRIDLEQEKK